jgi:hypothetical protein
MPAYVPTKRRVSDRLGDDQVASIIERFRAGTPMYVLAPEYGVSLSSIKRLLRAHDVRRRRSRQ